MSGAAVNQDFVTYSGDAISPIFLVQDSSGNSVDISTVSDIRWSAQINETSTALVSKTKSGGQISFVTSGADGQFQVFILAADTTLLAQSGDYFIHTAQVVDASGNVTTVTVGRMQVGLAPQWTYNPSQINTSSLYQVRYLIGDTLEGDQQLMDQEINFSIASYSNVTLAAADCCRALQGKFARLVDLVQGELKTNYSNKAKAYFAKAIDLEQRGLIRGGAMPYAGGISIDDKMNRVLNPDRVPPQFNLLMFDDLLPESPVGNQTPFPGSPDSGNFPV